LDPPTSRGPKGGPNIFFDPENHSNVHKMVYLEFRNNFGVNQRPSDAIIDRGMLGEKLHPPHILIRVSVNVA
jgi:hypothetical protein